MSAIPLNGELGIIICSEDEVAKAFLLEWIDHNFGWDQFREVIIQTSSLGCEVVSWFFNNINDDVDVTFNTPLEISGAEFEGNSIVDDMWSWFFFNQVEVIV